MFGLQLLQLLHKTLFILCRLLLLEQTLRQTDRNSEADQRYTHATAVGVSKNYSMCTVDYQGKMQAAVDISFQSQSVTKHSID